MYRFSYGQLVKYTAEHLAVAAGADEFAKMYVDRATAWGTPKYAQADEAFRAYLQPFVEQARKQVNSHLYDAYGLVTELLDSDLAAMDDAEADEVEDDEDYEEEDNEDYDDVTASLPADLDAATSLFNTFKGLE